MTILWRQLRDESIARLAAAGLDEAALEFRWIAERASGRHPAEQVAALDEPATEREVAFVDQMVGRRAAGEPLQYVLGRWAFRTLDLLVDRRVLIPRPESEVVAGLAVDVVASLDHDAVVVDLGTGSGAIALSLAAERWPHVEVWATDVSADALAVARANLAGLGRRAGVVRLLQGDWYAALPEDLQGWVDVIVSNPPYVATGEHLAPEVADWEPTTALLAGADGLDDLRRIIAEAPRWLRPGGVLVVEIGETQGAAVVGLAAAAGLVGAVVERDLADRDRALVARAPTGAGLAADDPQAADRVVDVLRAGGLVVLPTDTVYGLAALPGDRAAMDRVFAIKGRDPQVPIAVLCTDVDQALATVSTPVAPGVRAVAERWWPGPLTLVLPRRAGLDLHLGEPATTIGVRVPDNDLVRAVAARVGPLAVTSANRHGSTAAMSAAEARASLGPAVELVVDGGPTSSAASTVVDATRHPWRVVREGALSAGEILTTAEQA